MSRKFLLLLLGFLVILICVLISIILLSRNDKLTMYSEVQDIEISIRDKEVFVDLFKKWGLYSKDVELVNIYANPVEVKSISVILTPNIQSYDRYYDTDRVTIVQSAGYTYENKKLIIYVYLHPEKILSRSNDEISEWILYAAILRLKKISQGRVNEFTDHSVEVNDFVLKNNEAIKIIHN